MSPHTHRVGHVWGWKVVVDLEEVVAEPTLLPRTPRDPWPSGSPGTVRLDFPLEPSLLYTPRPTLGVVGDTFENGDSPSVVSRGHPRLEVGS